MAYAPKIKLDHDCGEADVSWQRFDELDTLTKADFLKDLMEIFVEKYNSVVEDKGFLMDLMPNKEKTVTE